MRSIQVSTEVFAAIWKARHEGEESENAILGRLLNVSPKSPVRATRAIGFRDPRYGVEFEEDFEIYRTYLGRDYRAKATLGNWMLVGSVDLYPSLNELSGAVGAKNENAWVNWFYSDPKGRRQAISTLRDQSRIIRRKRVA